MQLTVFASVVFGASALAPARHAVGAPAARALGRSEFIVATTAIGTGLFAPLRSGAAGVDYKTAAGDVGALIQADADKGSARC